jgi:hypothetical protein
VVVNLVDESRRFGGLGVALRREVAALASGARTREMTTSAIRPKRNSRAAIVARSCGESGVLPDFFARRSEGATVDPTLLLAQERR